MRIGIVCYASVGGSGVVATELALALAPRGHDVWLISSEEPFRWRAGVPRLMFERVETPAYPLFRQPQYVLSLTNAIVRLSRQHRLDIIHAHYAVPHATAAFLAHEILRADAGQRAPRTVTTLHGTDITLVGSDQSYAQVVAFSIAQSHGITAVSRSLAADTVSKLGITRPIRVIPNFLDCNVYRRTRDPAVRADLTRGQCDYVIVHASNFRPVKRVSTVVDVFRAVRARLAARLVLIGDGPDRRFAQRRVAEYGLADVVDFAGEQRDLVPWLSSADLFLLPSAQESFGVAALEAMACEVVVVATRVGGLPEVIEHGVNGFLYDVDDVQGMAESATRVLTDAALRRRVGLAARARVTERFCAERVVPEYERCYREVAGDGP